MRRFNPRLRTGGDGRLIRLAASLRSRFNPRLRTGGDLSDKIDDIIINGFQSAPPHGRRHR